MNSPDAEKLEKEYEGELARAHGEVNEKSGVRTKVEVLPTLDAHGKLYDVGTSMGGDDDRVTPGNKRRKEKVSTFKCNDATV